MKDVMGVINLVESTNYLKELTAHRPLGAVPIAGRYRMIDFALSNMVNSGITNVAVFLENNYRSLMDHLGSGKEWDLDRNRDGLFILPPNQRDVAGREQSDVELLYWHIDYFLRSKQETVIISGSSMICNIDYRKAVEFHHEKQADITMIYKPDFNGHNHSMCNLLEIDGENRITDLQMEPMRPSSNNVSMNIYILEKKLLLELLDQLASSGKTELLKDGISENLAELKVFGYPYTGYLGKINSLQDYYECSMELLNPRVWYELFFNSSVIFTKVKNEAPTNYLENAKVKNSLVANGCVIEGTVENSIIFRGVNISKGAHVKDSIVMQKSEIGEGSYLENVILDKETFVTKGNNLIGDHDYPLVVSKKTVL